MLILINITITLVKLNLMNILSKITLILPTLFKLLLIRLYTLLLKLLRLSQLSTTPNITYLFTILSIVLFLLPEQATAAIFDPPHTDKSIEYLGIVFGGNVGKINLGLSSADTTHFVGHFFQIFNGIILAVAIFILSYVGIVSTVNTAQEGQVMGKKWSSVWIPLRSAIGLLLLAPVPNSGYSFLQVTLMWIVLNGVGAADNLWKFVLTNLAHGISVTQNTEIANMDTNRLLLDGAIVGENLLNNLICLEIIKNKTNNHALKPRFVDEKLNPGIGTPVGATTMTGTIQFGSNDNPNFPARQNICGQMQITASIQPNDLTNANPLSTQRILEILTPSQEDKIVRSIYHIKKSALSLMIDHIHPIAKQIAKCKDTTGTIIVPDLEDIINRQGLLYHSTLIYQKAMSTLTKGAMMATIGVPITTIQQPGQPGANLISDEVLNQGKNLGWITAGSFYYLFSQKITQDLLDTATHLPNLNLANPFDPAAMALPPNTWFTNALTPASLNVTLNDFLPHIRTLNTPARLAQIDALFLDKPENADIKKLPIPFGIPQYLTNTNPILAPYIPLFVNISNQITQNIQGLFLENQDDPLISQAIFGMKIMGLAESCWTEIILSALGSNFIANAIANAGNAAMFTLIIGILPAILIFVGIMWTTGATLAIYTPMIPYIMFAITALSWIILVVEAIVAAPIVALGLITPAQDELGKIVPALGIIANIFLRPMLMIIGLIMGAKIYKAIINMVNLGFEFSFSSLQAQTGTTIFAWLAMLILYVGFIMTLANKCYALIYQLPDKVLRWIGVSGEPTDVSSVKEIQQGFEQQGKQAIGLMEGPATLATGQLSNNRGAQQNPNQHGGGGHHGAGLHLPPPGGGGGHGGGGHGPGPHHGGGGGPR